MALDLNSLMEPVSEDDPAGPDLSYDDERYTIEQVFDRSASVDASGEDAAAADIDWRGTIQLIEAQSKKTKDIWLPVYLCRAGAGSGDLATVELGAQYLAALLDEMWPTMHPSLEEYGFQGRKGPCDSLVGYAQFIAPLHRTILLQHPRLGRFSGDDFIRFNRNAEAEDGYGMFRAALEAAGEDGLQEALVSLENIEAAIRRADAVLVANAEGSTSTNFNATYDALKALKTAVRAFTASPGEEPEETTDDEQDQDAPSSAPRAAGPRAGGRLESRQDVLATLDTIVDYYKRHEPASPIPLMIQRVREWVTLDFLQVLGDIAPGSLDEARRVLLSRAMQENGDGF